MTLRVRWAGVVPAGDMRATMQAIMLAAFVPAPHPATAGRPGEVMSLPMHDLLRRTLAVFLPLAFVVTFCAGLTYVVAQQALRSGANAPQLQMAEDAAAALDAGAAPSSLVGTSKVDVAHSLAPFLVVFDASGVVLATDGVLDGHDPVPPRGILDGAEQDPPDTVTWQPRSGVRIAQVSVPWQGGVVLVGRSLREVERRTDQLLLLVAAAWLAGTAGAAGVSVIAGWAWPRRG